MYSLAEINRQLPTVPFEWPGDDPSDSIFSNAEKALSALKPAKPKSVFHALLLAQVRAERPAALPVVELWHVRGIEALAICLALDINQAALLRHIRAINLLGAALLVRLRMVDLKGRNACR